MRASKLYARDQRKRRACDWPSCFIAPEFFKPRSKKERVCLSLMPDRAISMHVYDVMEALQRAYDLGALGAKGDGDA